MFKTCLTIAGLFFTLTVMAQQNTKIEIQSLPPYHSSGSDLYIAGSFNGWNPQDSAYRFQKDVKGNYFIKLLLAVGEYEYKITRGGWNTVECDSNGAAVDNHAMTVSADAVIKLDIVEWVDRFPEKPKQSTASKNVHIVDTAFFIPQLKRTRRVWIYLPECYHESKKKFPVLYMQDGQNVFDDATAFAGEWGVDEYFDEACTRGIEAIVVAIDNGGIKRMNEYSPYHIGESGKGEGDEYVDFLVKTLKPFIDKNYRTAANKENTAIAGSSMGGLISLYAVLKYPKVFGGAGIFSPSLWISPKIFDDIQSKAGKVKSKIYFYAGKKESTAMVTQTLKAFEQMNLYSKSKMTIVIRSDGEHAEASWRKEFPSFYEWLLQED